MVHEMIHIICGNCGQDLTEKNMATWKYKPAEINEETGEVDAGTVERIEELKATFAEKLDAIGAYIKNLNAEIKALNDERKVIDARIKTKENKIESLKKYVLPFFHNPADTSLHWFFGF